MDWRSERENEPYTFRALAEEASINPNYLSNVMTGLRNPGVKTLRKIAYAFGLSMHDFYKGPDDGPETGRDAEDGGERETPEPVRPNPPARNDSTANDEIDLERPRDSMRISLTRNSGAELEAIFGTLGIETPGELLFDSEVHAPSVAEECIDGVKEQSSAPSPLLSADIPLVHTAGKWNSGEKTFPRFVGIESDGVFAVCLSDDSMAPELHRGDILYIDPDRTFSSANIGIGVVLHLERYMVRKIYDQGDAWRCVPLNGAFEPELIPKDQSRLYKVAHWFPQRDGFF